MEYLAHKGKTFVIHTKNGSPDRTKSFEIIEDGIIHFLDEYGNRCWIKGNWEIEEEENP